MRNYALVAVLAGLGLTALTGCSSSRPPTVAAAPPVGPTPSMAAPPVAAAPAGGVYDWRDVPVGEQVPVMRAVFDQAGYQIYAASGETIVVPFVNNNLYVLRFGRSDNGSTYFLNDGSAPTLYMPHDGFLENAVAQGARWYPLPRDYAYTRPVYVGLAPSWNDYVGMGWYPGMMVYGGRWGYAPTASFVWMPSFYFNVGGSRYNDFVSYRTYYTSHRGYVPNRTVYRNYTPPRRTVTNFGGSSGSFSSNRSTGSSGSFGSGRSGGTGSFGTGTRSSGFGSTGGGFGSSSGRSSVGSSTGSFGSGRSSVGSTGSSFGSSSGRSTGSFGSSSSAPSSSFGSSSGRSGGSSFGSGRTTGSSFGGSSGYSESGRSTGSSFGGTRSFGSSGGSFGRSSGSSFGSGSSSSSGGSSFGRSSSGGSFGRSSGRRR